MGGFQRLILRITPIIMLICFICLGITHTFQQVGTQNITYLSYETITLDNNNTEETTDDITIDNYTFDFTSYTTNIENLNILERSLNHTLDIDAYERTLNRFNTIWDDGYNVGDVSNSILNGVILVINTIILPINILLVPIRICSGIILTGLAIMGIRIDQQTPIITLLNNLVDKLTIPLINSTWARDGNIEDSIWQFKQNVTTEYSTEYHTFATINVPLNFTTESGGNFKQIFTDVYDVQQDSFNNYSAKTKMWYVDTDNNQILVYDDGYWYYDVKVINIGDVSNLTKQQLNAINYFLNLNAQRIG